MVSIALCALFLFSIAVVQEKLKTNRFPVARRILDHYRPEVPCFNDAAQTTGCVTLAAIIAGLPVHHQRRKDVKLVVFGAGTAGVGIADQVRDAIASEKGISKDEAAKQIW